MTRELRNFIVVKIILLIPTIFILLVAIFIAMRVIPGDPIEAMYAGKIPEGMAEVWRHRLGLDLPLHQQFFNYLANLFRGDFGISISTQKRVLELIWEYFPATFELVIVSYIFAIIIGVLSGALSAVKGGFVDHLIRGVTLFGYTLPTFWFGVILQLTLGVYLGILPVSGRIAAFAQPTTITGLYILDSILTVNMVALISSLKHMILPAITLGLYVEASISRLTRANMLETLGHAYITTARAKGLSEVQVIIKHALRNALLPIVTIASMQFAIQLGGAVLTETVFSFPGLGRLLVSAIAFRDFPLVQGCMLFIVLIIALFSILVDILYYLLDPRVKL